MASTDALKKISIGLTFDTPRRLDAAFTIKIVEAVKAETKIFERRINKSIASWTPSNKPVWKTALNVSSAAVGDISASFYTESTPFVWVMSGTNKGNAMFSLDYKPKTQPGRAKSGTGAGMVLRRGKKAPRVKIKARNFHYILADQRTKFFSAKILKILMNQLKVKQASDTVKVTYVI